MSTTGSSGRVSVAPKRFSHATSPTTIATVATMTLLDSTGSAVRLRRSGSHRRCCYGWRLRSVRIHFTHSRSRLIGAPDDIGRRSTLSG